jgi:acyl-CoA synthetase (AMP-forming)/AMP-acid ligase II
MARHQPDNDAVIFEERRYSYSEFDKRTDRMGNALIKAGVAKGDKVAQLLFNCSELLEAYLAVCKIGAVNVPLNFRLTGPDIFYQLDNSESRLLIFGEEFTYIIEEIRSELKDFTFVCVGVNIPDFAQSYGEFLAGGRDGAPGITVFDDDPAFVMYTSGTTGKPKGAVLTHKNQMMNILNCTIELLKVTDEMKDERVQFVAPLFHEAALAFALYSISTGAAICIQKFFEPEKVAAMIQEERITATLLIPVMTTLLMNMVDLSKYDTSNLKYYISGAAILPTETRKQIYDAFGGIMLFDIFGQTEMSPVTCMLKPEDGKRKVASVGRPVVNVEVRVFDDKDQDVPLGQVGEIVYRGPTVMKEYYRNPEATAETLRNGWFHSGDLVKQDEEGFVYVVDRKKDMIISGGENVYAAEVEDVLYQNPKILEAAVIGSFDETWGEIVMAVVVPKEGVDLTEKEVKDWCAEKLAGYKKPRHVEFTDVLPRNAAMKVLKYELRERYGKSVRYD